MTSEFENARRRFVQAAAKLGGMAAIEEAARWDRIEAERLLAAATLAKAKVAAYTPPIQLGPTGHATGHGAQQGARTEKATAEYG